MHEQLSLSQPNNDALEIDKQTLNDVMQNFESRPEKTIKESFEDRKMHLDNIILSPQRSM